MNVTASIQGNTGITIGNIIGSNIANILLILGVAGVICPAGGDQGHCLERDPAESPGRCCGRHRGQRPFPDGAAVSVLSRAEGLILLCFFIIFLYYSASIARNFRGVESAVPKAVLSPKRIGVMMAIGFVALIVGSQWVVDGAVKMATALGISESVIGLTIVAVGTSLPELATSAAAAYRRNPDIAIGNVVGSNIFNIFFILGVSAVIRPIPFAAGEFRHRHSGDLQRRAVPLHVHGQASCARTMAGRNLSLQDTSSTFLSSRWAEPWATEPIPGCLV